MRVKDAGRPNSGSIGSTEDAGSRRSGRPGDTCFILKRALTLEVALRPYEQAGGGVTTDVGQARVPPDRVRDRIGNLLAASDPRYVGPLLEIHPDGVRQVTGLERGMPGVDEKVRARSTRGQAAARSR